MKTHDAQLRNFLRIADARSLSAAAESLGVSQSGLSRQLGELEAAIGMPLFVRTGRGVELTEAGAKLRATVQPAFEAIDARLQQLKLAQGVSEGSVRVATVHTLSHYFIAELLSRFLSANASINVSLLGRSSPEVVDLVETGRAEVGFVYDSAVATDAVISQPLFDDPMCLLVKAGSPFSGQACIDLEAEALPLIGFPPSYALRRMLSVAKLDQRVVAEVDTVEAMLALVGAGIGACILPTKLPDHMLRQHGLARVQIASPRLSRRVVCITRKGVELTPLAQRLVRSALGG